MCTAEDLKGYGYDASMFDKRGIKTFVNKEVWNVGPLRAQKQYITPKGWTRIGLKVRGKYVDDEWLSPFAHAKNWYRSYHGTGINEGASILKGNFIFKISDGRNGTRAAYGPGIYNSPDIDTARKYSKPVTIQTKAGSKRYYFVLMVAVNPATLNKTRKRGAPKNIWIAPSPSDIRPYGILLQEC